MRYADIKFCDSGNGPGARTSLFVSGCNRHCPGCFNDYAWPFDYGQVFTDETKESILNSLAPDYIEGLSILGGEPLDPKNCDTVYDLIKAAKQLYPSKSVWLFTGYTFEELIKARETNLAIKNILKEVDVLKDGPFMEEHYAADLLFRGSSNQRLLDIPASLSGTRVVLWADPYE